MHASQAFRFLFIFVFLLTFFHFTNAEELKVVGGQPADSEEWPATVALLRTSTVDLVESGTVTDANGNIIPAEQANYTAQFCGGTLISPKWALTAAHCLYSNTTPLTPADLLALTGASNLIQGGQRMVVTNIFIHPDYDPATHDSDIALLELAGNAPAPAQPVSLFPGSPGDGEDATVVGWGARNFDNSSALYSVSDDFASLLHEDIVPVVESPDCGDAYPDVITNNMVCAGYLEGSQDSCQGDSGGPLMVGQGSSAQQIGIVSFAEGCALPDVYGVYTRVDNFSGWIASLISNGVINQPPVAGFDASCDRSGSACHVAPPARGRYEFYTNGSTDPDGQIVSYHWDFGDGVTTETPFGSPRSHKYTLPGEYIVTLTVTDDGGLTSSASKTIIIDEFIPPEIETSTINIVSASGLTVEVDTHVAGSMGNGGFCEDAAHCVATMYLDYGDGERDLVRVYASGNITFPFIGNRAYHTYAAPGTYTLTLTTQLVGRSLSFFPGDLEDVVTKEITVPPSSSSTPVDETNLSASQGEYLHYSFEVAPGATNLNVLMSNVNDDPDLYVRYGSAPTLDDYDCRPYKGGGENEVCDFNNPQAGIWYVMVHAYSNFSGVDLKVTTTTGGGGEPDLLNESNIRASQGEFLNYSFNVGADTSSLNVLMSNVNGDPDLYVRYGSAPTLDDFDCRPYKGGNTEEVCDFSNPQAGTWYVMVHAYSDFSGVNLVATAETDGSGGGNNNPQASPDTFSASKDQPLTITTASLLANDSDPDGDDLTVTSVSNAVHGSVISDIGSGDITFTPESGYTGEASFTYSISDGQGGAASTTATITVGSTPSSGATLDFENTAQGEHVGLTLDGFQFDSDGGSLVVLDVTEEFYGVEPNVVIRNAGWLETTTVKKVDGSLFNINSFDYQGIWSDGTATITGYLADGSVISDSIGYSEQSALITKTLGWEGLTRIEIAFDAYAFMDNFEF